MQVRDRRARILVLSLAIVATAALVAGCGSDDDDDESSEPSSIALEASGTAKAQELTAPSEAEAGPAEITFTNNTDGNLDGQLIYVPEGEDHSDEEVIAELDKAVNSRPVADWFQGGGGPGFVDKGGSTTVTQDLEAGTYYFVPGSEGAEAPLTKITVTGESDAELPEADATVNAAEYTFTADGPLKAGEQSVLLDNIGGTWHHFQVFPMKPNATIDQVKQFFETEEGPPPFSENLPIESTVMEGGTSQLVDANLEAGNYAFVCFIADKAGGPPHFVKGMVSEIEVTE